MILIVYGNITLLPSHQRILSHSPIAHTNRHTARHTLPHNLFIFHSCFTLQIIDPFLVMMRQKESMEYIKDVYINPKQNRSKSFHFTYIRVYTIVACPRTYGRIPAIVVRLILGYMVSSSPLKRPSFGMLVTHVKCTFRFWFRFDSIRGEIQLNALFYVLASALHFHWRRSLFPLWCESDRIGSAGDEQSTVNTLTWDNRIWYLDIFHSVELRRFTITIGSPLTEHK